MRILLFILLKLLEIGAVIFMPYWFKCLLEGLLDEGYEKSKIMKWSMGCAILGLLFVISVIIVDIIPVFLKFNWELVDKIMRIIKTN